MPNTSRCDDQTVDHEQGLSSRDAGDVLKEPRCEVGAACGGTAAEYNAKARPEHQAAIDASQERRLCQGMALKRIGHLQEHRHQNDPAESLDREFPSAEIAIACPEQRDVDHERADGDREAKQMVEQDGDAGDTAGHHFVRHKDPCDRDRDDERPKGEVQIIEEQKSSR